MQEKLGGCTTLTLSTRISSHVEAILIVHSTWIDDRWLILDIIPSVALLSGHSSAYYAVGAIAMNLSISASAKVCCLLKLNRAACVDQPECGASESSRILPWKSHLGVT
jgi:hypothetical protein